MAKARIAARRAIVAIFIRDTSAMLLYNASKSPKPSGHWVELASNGIVDITNWDIAVRASRLNDYRHYYEYYPALD